MFQRLFDQAVYYNCSLYKTGEVRCMDLISGGMETGGVESVSNEEGYSSFSDDKKRFRSYRVAGI